MQFEVECRNILRYDPEAGKYVHCGCQIKVDRNKAGTNIKCPDCGAQVEAIPADVEELTTADSNLQSLFSEDIPSAHDNSAEDEPLHMLRGKSTLCHVLTVIKRSR